MIRPFNELLSRHFSPAYLDHCATFSDVHRSIFASTASCPRIRIARYPTTSRRAFSRGLSRHFLIKTSAVNVSCAQLRREAPGGEDFPKESRIASSFTHPLETFLETCSSRPWNKGDCQGWKLKIARKLKSSRSVPSTWTSFRTGPLLHEL